MNQFKATTTIVNNEKVAQLTPAFINAAPLEGCKWSVILLSSVTCLGSKWLSKVSIFINAG